jgi:hypothetical protein
VNYLRKNAANGTSSTIIVTRFAFRLASTPAATAGLFQITADGGNNMVFRWEQSSGGIRVDVGSSSATSAPISAGTWYYADVRFNAGANPRTVDWRLNGVAQTQVSSAETASYIRQLRVGGYVSGDAYTANYDDLIVSETSADYPIGDGKILASRPDGLGTHNTAGNYQNDDNSAIGASTAGRLDDTDLSSTSDYVKQITGSSSSYVALSLADTAESCVNLVRGIVSYRSSASSPANAAATRFLDAATTTSLTHLIATTTNVSAGMITPATTWSGTALNGLVAHVGFATPVTAVPYWDGVMVEYNVDL